MRKYKFSTKLEGVLLSVVYSACQLDSNLIEPRNMKGILEKANLPTNSIDNKRIFGFNSGVDLVPTTIRGIYVILGYEKYLFRFGKKFQNDGYAIITGQFEPLMDEYIMTLFGEGMNVEENNLEQTIDDFFKKTDLKESNLHPMLEKVLKKPDPCMDWPLRLKRLREYQELETKNQR